MQVASLVLLVVVATMADVSQKKFYDVKDAPNLFDQFIKDHNRSYKDDADRDVHYQAFVANLAKINEMNEKSPTATFGINKFADYTEEERKSMTGFKRD